MNKKIDLKKKEDEISNNDKIMKMLTEIAQDSLGMETLETRMSDHLDFKEVSVWGICSALKKAYLLGRLEND